MITRATFLLFGLLGLCLFSACGSDITFPQGPTSGADDISSNVPRITVQTHSDFDLRVAYLADENTFQFDWDKPADRHCDRYRLFLVKTPDPNAATSSQLRVLSFPIETDLLSAGDHSAFVEIVEASDVPLSVTAVCVLDAQSRDLGQPLSRSDFEDLSHLIDSGD